MAAPLLLSPVTLRGVTARNRIVVSPMCQYSAENGLPNDWHLVHLGKLALGGAGTIFIEATAVEARGRITHGDTGIWEDAQVPAHRRVTDFIKAHGAQPAIQLGHAGRKASMQRPWHGNGPLDETDAARGDHPWQIVAPSELPVGDGWLVPHALSTGEIQDLLQRWIEATRRAVAAGYEIAEVHGAHGYLIQSFLSPIANKRNDAYGGDLAGRMRLALEVAEAVRGAWPEDKPLFFRVSSIDGIDGGWTIEETLTLAKALRQRGVDVIDCSSGGIAGSATAARVRRGPGFQVPFAERVRHEADMKTMAVGLITHPRQAEAILQEGRADLIAIGREALRNPNWPLDAAAMLASDAASFTGWPEQYGWWLSRRAQSCDLYKEAS